MSSEESTAIGGGTADFVGGEIPAIKVDSCREPAVGNGKIFLTGGGTRVYSITGG